MPYDPSNPQPGDFGTERNTELDRAIAKYLRTKKNFQMTPGMAVLPRAWMNNIPDLIDSFGAGAYQSRALDQEVNRNIQSTNPGSPAVETPRGPISKLLKEYFKGTKPVAGVAPAPPALPGAEPGSITGSLPQPGQPQQPQQPQGQQQDYDPDDLTPYGGGERYYPPLPYKQGDMPDIPPEQPEQTPDGVPVKRVPTQSIPGKPQTDQELIDTSQDQSRANREGLEEADKLAPPISPGTPNYGQSNLPRSNEGPPAVAPYKGLQPNKLGGPKGEDKPFESQEATDRTGNWIKIDGYEGPAPNVPYVETREQIQHKMMNSNDPNKVLDEWRERQKPYMIPVKDGSLMVTPRQGGGGDFKFIASPQKEYSIESPTTSPTFKGREKINEMNLPGRGGGGPGGGAGLRGSPYEDLRKEKAGIESEAAEASKIRAFHVKNMMDHAEEGLNRAPKEIQNLRAMRIANEEPWSPRGPSANFMVELRQLLANYGQTVKGTDKAEVFEKLNAQAARAISDRNSAFSLSTFMEKNPGLKNTQAGARLLIDMMEQEARQRQFLGKKALEYTPENASEFTKYVSEYYNDHPITLTGQDGVKWTTKKYNSPEEVPDNDEVWFDSKGRPHQGRH